MFYDPIKNNFFKLLIKKYLIFFTLFFEKLIYLSSPLCPLYITIYHLKFYREYKSSGNPRDQITSKISSHVQAIKKIYEKTNFEGIRGIGFLVSRLRVCKLSIFIMLYLNAKDFMIDLKNKLTTNLI